ncbi:hypothetical protein BH24ACT4_BH24ACT4_10440 [soil metagenome]
MNTVSGVAASGVVEIGTAKLAMDQTDLSGPVVVGVRPEHLVVAPDGPLRTTVRHVEWLGHEALATVDLTDAVASDATPPRWIVRLEPGVAPPEPGSELALRPAEGQLHLFDADTGWRPGARPDGAPAASTVDLPDDDPVDTAR